jgi:soluble cytochrome b562
VFHHPISFLTSFGFLVFSLAYIPVLAPPALARESPPEDALEKAWSQYSSQSNPVDRAKALAKLASRQMSAIRDSSKADRDDQALAALEKFRDAVSETTKALAASNIDAARKPKGFKELQISLRVFIRKLDDLTLSLQQDVRDGFRAARMDLESAENLLIDALFPAPASASSR